MGSETFKVFCDRNAPFVGSGDGGGGGGGGRCLLCGGGGECLLILGGGGGGDFCGFAAG